ncbi:CLUMA_CG016785, isoform A [Clunio marinus]|uniref:CLUMA_CG016785, isoform A n=1 Tax=Clunio marinus TaxID=568069 RepID=A0A1J1IXL1_9DIPT|nr:CLUMA_CG016785, isoform A [Clunio marinus]
MRDGSDCPSGWLDEISMYTKCGLSFFPATKLKKSCCWLQNHLLALLRSCFKFKVFKASSDGFTSYNYDDGFICICCNAFTAPFSKFYFYRNLVSFLKFSFHRNLVSSQFSVKERIWNLSVFIGSIPDDLILKLPHKLKNINFRKEVHEK